MNFKRRVGAAFVALLIVSMVVLFMADAALAAGGSGVTRTVASAGNGESEVTISINDTMPSVCGLKETLPAGSTLVSCTLSPGQYEVSGSELRFVAINTTSFKYVVKGLDGKEITGQWTDMLGTGQGTVNAGGATGTDAAGGSSTNTQAAPGFATIIALASIGMVALLSRRD